MPHPPVAELEAFVRNALPPAAVPRFDTLVRQLSSRNSSVLRTVTDAPSALTLDPPEPTDDPPTEGRAFVGVGDRYEDLGRIGIGGMGEVRRVRDRDLGRTMAMKIIRAELMARPKVVARFIEEAQCSAQLQHTGIVPVHEIGRMPDGRLYFTMAEVRGRTLAEVIAEVHWASKGDRWGESVTGWTFRGLVDAFHRVCEAVSYAHSRGVVHRDLKPENVMVGEHGEVLVVDWGLAKVVGRPDLAAESGDLDPVVTDRSQDESKATRMGAVAGTPAYMPPEQANGEIDRIDARSDVYALGAILYEILSGRAPYEGSSGFEVLSKVKSGPPAPPGRAVGLAETFGFGFDDEDEPAPAAVSGPPLPAELVAAVERSMSREPFRRFGDAGVLATEVAAWLDGARRREQALNVVTQALALEAEKATAQARAQALEAEAEALLADVETWAPEEEKSAGWAKEDEAAALQEKAKRLDRQLEQGLTAALRIDATLPEAHAALALRHLSEHEVAEVERQPEETTRAAELFTAHAEALPVDHAVRQRCAAYLKGDGALTLVTEPAGAEVQLYRYAEHNRRLVPEFVRNLGRTPLDNVTLPMGSYLCVLQAEGRADVRYPVHIGRGHHWEGIPPEGGEPHAIWLPSPDDLGADESYVPSGWFTAGGDPNALNSLSRRRVWVDDFSISRFPVTNRAYLNFLCDLVKQGREAEALAHAPKADEGSVYGYSEGRFSLSSTADFGVWEAEWPVCLVSWRDAVAYATWFASQTGVPWRLLHELEWEKAARGVDGRFYPWGDGCDPSWCHMAASHQGQPRPAVVGAYAVDESVYEARDMAGNMMDWTETEAKGDGDVCDGGRVVPMPCDPESGAIRVDRGGSWGYTSALLRVSARHGGDPGGRFRYIGFRLARTIPRSLDPSIP